MTFAMGNCITLEDTNGNRKLYKKRYDQKIDSVAAMMDAYIAFKLNRDAFEQKGVIMWQYQNTDELYHYGIPGMRWGIRRAQKILGSSDASVDKKKKAVQSLQKHQIKINKQISKLNKKDEQLLSNRDVQIRKSAGKMMNYKEKANKLRRKKYGIFTSRSKAERLEFKASKLDMKAENIQNRIDRTKQLLAKNSQMKKIYNSGLDTISDTLKTKGKKYIT